MSAAYRVLRPHHPLDPGDSAYLPRSDGAPRIVEALQSAPVVGVVGPTGVGKSTELAAAVSIMKGTGRSAFHVPVDRRWNMRALQVDQLYLEIAHAVSGQRLASTGSSVWDEVVIALRGAGERPVIVIDGLEKVPRDIGPVVLDALGALLNETDVVTVLPWYSAYGPTALRIIADQERVLSLRSLDPAVDKAFFHNLVLKRVKADESESLKAAWIDEAALLSGGLPRTFLQLVTDTLLLGTDPPDLQRAVREQQDSFRRSLLPGDAEAIRASAGTDGREIELDRRIRLLSSGLLLERMQGDRVEVVPHPILKPLLG